MRYFDEALIANNPRQHGVWWEELCANREHFHAHEEYLGSFQANASPILPREAWMEMDDITRRVMRHDEGQVWMNDLMALAKPVHIGALVHMSRVSGDAGKVVRSMSGQVPIEVDKVDYDFRGAPVPIFATGYGRKWREWNVLQNNNFDALSDDQEAHTKKIRRDMAIYTLDGDPEIVFQNYPGYGLRTHPLTKKVNLGTAAGGAAIDLTSFTTTSDEIDNFITGYFGAILDGQLVNTPINMYISPEIGRRLDAAYSGSAGTKQGSMLQHLLANRRIGKIAVTFELTGNQFFAFVPSSEFIRPLVGMALNTTPRTRLNPTDDYHFMVMGAMGLEIRGDINSKSGVFVSEVVNA